MNTRTDYGQLADKLDYSALERKLTQLAEREPPKARKTAADVLEPLREKLLALHRKGWSSSQLVEELKAAGVPVSRRDSANVSAAGPTTASESQNHAPTAQCAATVTMDRPPHQHAAKAHPRPAKARLN
jgi:hypothetical protein